MKAEAYGQMAEQERGNWYYRARALAIETLIRRFVRPDNARRELRILDVGCGTGGTTIRLASFGPVLGIEPSANALEILKANYPSLAVQQGRVQDLPRLLPRAEFDLVTVLGVLYHRQVADPQAALVAIRRVVRDEGWILWNECVYPCLARGHDELVEGGRRFYPAEMHRLLREAGFDVVFSSHFLGWGFPVAWLLAAGHRLRRRFGLNAVGGKCPSAGDDRPLPSWLNALLYRGTYQEWRASLWGLKVPCGVSRLILARARTNPGGSHSIGHHGTDLEPAVNPCH
jgi:SAM-dependent methyltransferase